MLKYVFRRLFVFIPTVLVISLLTFYISLNSPGDPVMEMMNRGGETGTQLSSRLANERSYVEKRKQLGLDLPVFYFSISSASIPDTLYRIPYADRRSALERIAFTSGNWPGTARWYTGLLSFERLLYSIQVEEGASSTFSELRYELNRLFLKYNKQEIRSSLEVIRGNVKQDPRFFSLAREADRLWDVFEKLTAGNNSWNRYIPAFHFYGLNNQYHRWISGFFTGDFGTSYQDGRPVAGVLSDAVAWTLKISLWSILIAYMVSVPIGVYCAVNKGTKKEKLITSFLFILYSLPVFWIATLTIIFLCGGDWLSVFPAPGEDPVSADAPLYIKMADSVHRLFLPLFCLTYGSLAFISRQMRGGMLSVLQQDYIRTAYAKGLPGKKVIWKHAFRNSLIPVITLFASVFPVAVSGSLIVEYIFSIPGMGKLSYEALVARNYPVIFAVMMVISTLTLFGNLVADVLYAWADPRISFSSLEE